MIGFKSKELPRQLAPLTFFITTSFFGGCADSPHVSPSATIPDQNTASVQPGGEHQVSPLSTELTGNASRLLEEIRGQFDIGAVAGITASRENEDNQTWKITTTNGVTYEIKKTQSFVFVIKSGTVGWTAIGSLSPEAQDFLNKLTDQQFVWGSIANARKAEQGAKAQETHHTFWEAKVEEIAQREAISTMAQEADPAVFAAYLQELVGFCKDLSNECTVTHIVNPSKDVNGKPYNWEIFIIYTSNPARPVIVIELDPEYNSVAAVENKKLAGMLDLARLSPQMREWLLMLSQLPQTEY